jgi:hypothetical protein
MVPAMALLFAAGAASAGVPAPSPSPPATASPAAAGRAAAVPASIQRAIEALYQRVCTAALDPSRENVEAAASVFAPDFTAVDESGRQYSHDEVVTELEQQLSVMRASRCTTEIVSASAPDPETVVAVDSLQANGTMQAPDGPHVVDVASSSSDTWKLVGGAWVEERSNILHTLVKIDGRVVQHSGE